MVFINDKINTLDMSVISQINLIQNQKINLK